MLDFDLDAQRGSFHLQLQCQFPSAWTVIFGPSGSGKSTVLRLLAGLDQPARGRIVLDGETLTDVAQGTRAAAGRRRTALVGQKSALFPHMTVAMNVAYGLAHIENSLRAPRVAEMLELFDAQALANRRPKDLSGGEAQRVALARALATYPRLLLLDEPFSALDGAASDVLLARLQGWVSEHHVQTVLATHDATDAYTTSADVALIREGRLIALGPASQALTAERHRILGLLSSNNLVEP